MSRKVYIEGEATILVPVKVKFSCTVRADEDANIDKALKAASQQKRYSKADVEDLDVDEIIDVNGYEDPDDFEAGVQETLENSAFTIISSKVIDSK